MRAASPELAKKVSEATCAPRSVLPGFGDPVGDSQSTFRAVLAALAEPAIIRTIDAEVPNIGLPSASLAILLALADIDTPCWASEEVGAGVRDYLRFHTGVRFVDDPAIASLAVVASLATMAPLDAFAPGTAISPETSATVIVAVKDLTSGAKVLLDGPGFESPRELAPAGFDDARWDEVAANNLRFPAGVDLLIVTGNSVVGLPRSTRVIARVNEPAVS